MPVTEDLNRALKGMVGRPGVAERAASLAERQGFFHWHTAFADVMENRGGFDVVLANPPWERIKLQEKEFFARRSPPIAQARTKAERHRLIGSLARPGASLAERALHRQFLRARREAEASSHFLRRSGRFRLTSHGDINTYAVFAETCLDLLNKQGRAGIIVPTGIATDHSTRRFFQTIVENRRLVSLRDFENKMALFKSVHRSYKFSLLTLGSDVERASYVCFASKTAHLRDDRRRFELTRRDIRLINPNTRTAPLFRSRADAELAKKIYSRVPPLVDESRSKAGNPWGVRFMRMFDMSNDSGLFRKYSQLREMGARIEGKDWIAPDGKVWVPLMEAKMIHQFDHRWSTYERDGETPRLVTEAEKSDNAFHPLPRYWVPKPEVDRKLSAIECESNCLVGWRRIARATDERTIIATAIPKSGVGDSLFLIFCSPHIPYTNVMALLGNLNSIVVDFIARLKLGGANINYFFLRQLPILPPKTYQDSDLTYIVSRVLRLMNLGNPRSIDNDMIKQSKLLVGDRRSLRAQLDAYYSHLYGLDIHDIRYILDPNDVFKMSYPSESFRILRDRELKQFGQFITRNQIVNVWEEYSLNRFQ